MKNLKLNGKLAVSFGLVLFMVFACAGVAIFSMNNIGKQIDQYSSRTVPNTGYVWNMRRNLVSAQRNLLGAIVSNDQAKISDYLNKNTADAKQFF